MHDGVSQSKLSSLGSRDIEIKIFTLIRSPSPTFIPFYYRQPSKALKFTRQQSKLDTLTVNRHATTPLRPSRNGTSGLVNLASNAGVFRGARFSSLPTKDELP